MSLFSFSSLSFFLLLVLVAGQPGIGPIDITPSPSSNPTLPPKAPTPTPTPPPTQFTPSPSHPEPPGVAKLTLVHSSDSEISPLSSAWVAKWAALVASFTGGAAGNGFYVSGGNNWRSGPGYDSGAYATDAIRSALNNQFVSGGPGRLDLTVQTVVGLSASALGPHEFDANPSGLQSLIQSSPPEWQGSQFPFLASNLDFSQSSELSGLYTDDILSSDQFASLPSGPNYKLSSSTTIRTDDGHLYGVVGLSPGDIRYYAQSDSVWSMNSVYPNKPRVIASLVQKRVDALLDMNINKVILLANVGSVALAKAIAPFLSGVDVIVAGGVLEADQPANVMVTNPRNLFPGDNQGEAYPYQTTDKDGSPVVIVYTKGLYEYVGNLVLKFDGNGRVTSATGDVWPATDEALTRAGASKNSAAYVTVSNLAQAALNYFTGLNAQVVAKSTVYVDGEDSGNQETTMGDLIANSYLWYLARNKISANLALVSASSITGNFGYNGNPPYQNKVTKLDVALAEKDNYFLSIVNVTAAGLKSEFENSIYGYLIGNRDSFLQMSHVSVLYNTYQVMGNRVRNLYILSSSGHVVDTIVQNGIFIGDPSRTITVATNVFLANGHNGFTFPISSIGRLDTSYSSQDAFQEYLTFTYLETPYTNTKTAGLIQVENDRTSRAELKDVSGDHRDGKESTEILS